VGPDGRDWHRLQPIDRLVADRSFPRLLVLTGERCAKLMDTFRASPLLGFLAGAGHNAREIILETLLKKIEKLAVIALAGMLAVVVLLSTLHLGVLIAQEIWVPPRFLIRVQGLLEIFGYFLLVLIGVEFLETLKAYLKKDVIHVRVVLEVALIAMARKVIIEEPNSVPSSTLLGIAALILALGVAFYFERHAKRGSVPSPGQS
jgi:uncharacterized membrane protein (DUF373 family)